jgi:hypothetical protein
MVVGLVTGPLNAAGNVVGMGVSSLGNGIMTIRGGMVSLWGGTQTVLQNTRDMYRWFEETIQKLPIYLRFPFVIISMLFKWVLFFFKSCGFFWGTLYFTIVVWLFLGLTMYPMLLLEQYPDTLIDIYDGIFDFIRVFYNILAGAWNLSIDLVRPIMPPVNLWLEYCYRYTRLMVLIFAEMLGAVTGEESTLSTHLNLSEEVREAAGLDMSWYKNFMIPIFMSITQLLWTILDVGFMIYEVVIRYILHIIVGIITFLLNLTRWFTCCFGSFGCCFMDIIQILVNYYIESRFNIFIRMLHAISIFGISLFGWIPLIPYPPIACGYDTLVSEGMDCKCSFEKEYMPYTNMPSCKKCHFRCEETGNTMNWIKECPPGVVPESEIIEHGWCSHAPPEGKGPRPDVAQTRAVISREVFHHNLLSRTEDLSGCYDTCLNGLRYERCLASEFIFNNASTGTCSSSSGAAASTSIREIDIRIIADENIEHRGRHHHNHDFNEKWKTVEADIRNTDDELQCRYWFDKYDDQTIKEQSIRDIFHYEMCVIRHGFDPGPGFSHLVMKEKMEDVAQQVHTTLTPPGGVKGQGQERLTGTLDAMHDLASSVGFHTKHALSTHLRSWEPTQNKTRTSHFLEHFNTKAVQRSWKTYTTRIEELNKKTMYSTVLARMKSHLHSSLRSVMLPRDVHQVSVMKPRGIFRKGDDGCPCKMKLVNNEEIPFDCQKRCSDGLTCVDKMDDCPAMEETNWGLFWGTFMRSLERLQAFDAAGVFNVVFVCWNDRTDAENPLSSENVGVTEHDRFVYCFPQVDPYTDLYVHAMEFDVWTWVEQQCGLPADVLEQQMEDYRNNVVQYKQEAQTCICSQYDTKNIYEYDAYWFWFVPYYVKARVTNALRATQFILAHYLTRGTFIDRMWTSLFDVFFPHQFSSSIRHFFGLNPQTSANMEWFCVFLHLGSLEFAIFWIYISFIIYRCFFSFLKMVYYDIASILLSAYTYAISFTQTQTPNSFVDQRFVQTPHKNTITIKQSTAHTSIRKRHSVFKSSINANTV